MSNIGPNAGNPNPYLNQPAHQQQGVQQGQTGNIGNTQNTQATPQQLLTHAAQQLLGELLLVPLMHYQAQGMNPQEVRLFFRNLLQLPPDIQQLFAQLATGQDGQQVKSLLQLLKAMPDIPLKDLQNLLQQSIKQGEGKMMDILQSTNMTQSGNSKMMGEMMSTMSKLGIQVASSPADALTTTMMLYLPWYPITAQQKMTLHFEQPKSEGGEGAGQNGEEAEAHLVMLLETKNMGNARIVVAPINTQQILISVQSSDQILGLKPEVEAEVNEKLHQDHLSPPEYVWAGFSGQKATVLNNSPDTLKEEAVPSKTPNEDPQMAVHAVGKVPLLVINTAYLMARVIFRLDNVAEEVK